MSRHRSPSAAGTTWCSHDGHALARHALGDHLAATVALCSAVVAAGTPLPAVPTCPACVAVLAAPAPDPRHHPRYWR